MSEPKVSRREPTPAERIARKRARRAIERAALAWRENFRRTLRLRLLMARCNKSENKPGAVCDSESLIAPLTVHPNRRGD